MKQKLSILFLFISFTSFSQSLDGMRICMSLQSTVNSFSSINDANKALDEILYVSGASKSFILLECSEINNVVAISFNGNRYILYDRDFMNSISRKTNNWSNIFILAHEIGHHINGHSRDIALSYRGPNTSLEVQREEELEADLFAGLTLAKLGASLSDASQAIKLISPNSNDRFSTHPNRQQRIAAITEGWRRGKSSSTISSSLNVSSNEAIAGVFSDWITEVKVPDDPFKKKDVYSYTEGQFVSDENNLTNDYKPLLKVTIKGGEYEISLEEMGVKLDIWDSNFYSAISDSETNQILRDIKNGIKVINHANEVVDQNYLINTVKEVLFVNLKSYKKDYFISFEFLFDDNSRYLGYKLITDDKETTKFTGLSFIDIGEYIDKIEEVPDFANTTYFVEGSYPIITSYDFINKLKANNKVYVRFFDDTMSRNLKINLELGQTGPYIGKSYFEIDVIQIRTINNTNGYYQFSLSGSSKALNY